MDFHIKKDFLSKLAEDMARKGRFSIEHGALLEFSTSYFCNRGLKARADLWMQQFIDARIFYLCDDHITFRYRAFYEWFVASRMLQSDEFREYVLNEHNCPHYMFEIEYYGAMKRDDSKLLKLIENRYCELREKIFGDWRPRIADFDEMRGVSYGDEVARKQIFDEVDYALGLPKFTDEERDGFLQRGIPGDLGCSQDVEKAKVLHECVQLTVYLVMYTKLLRNMELLPLSDKKKHFRNVIEGWSEFLVQSFFWIPTIARERTVVINGIRFVVVAPAKVAPEEIGRRLYLRFPVAYSELLLSMLGTEKLELVLKSDELYGKDEKEPHVVTFFRALLYADLRLENSIEQLKMLERRLGKFMYLREALLEKSKDMFLGTKFDSVYELSFRKFVAEVKAGLTSTSGLERSKQISGEMQNLRKGALIREIKNRGE